MTLLFLKHTDVTVEIRHRAVFSGRSERAVTIHAHRFNNKNLVEVNRKIVVRHRRQAVLYDIVIFEDVQEENLQEGNLQLIPVEYGTESEDDIVEIGDEHDFGDFEDQFYNELLVSRLDPIGSFRVALLSVLTREFVINDVRFIDEIGEGNALLREFHCLYIQKAIEDEQLFIMDDRSRTFIPNKSKAKICFIEFGIVFGSAMKHSISLGRRFTPLLYRFLAQEKYLISDLDPWFSGVTENIRNMSEQDLKDSALFFTDIEGKPLIKGAEDIQIDAENRFVYLKRLTKWYVTRFSREFEFIKQGYYRTALTDLSFEKLKETAQGKDAFDLALWKKHTKVKDVPPQIIQWFWDYIEQSHEVKQKRIFRWVTGYETFPLEKDIEIAPLNHSGLPMASTCALTLWIPVNYDSPDMLVSSFDRAIIEFAFDRK